jgi:hypothetical protein
VLQSVPVASNLTGTPTCGVVVDEVKVAVGAAMADVAVKLASAVKASAAEISNFLIEFPFVARARGECARWRSEARVGPIARAHQIGGITFNVPERRPDERRILAGAAMQPILSTQIL